MIDWPEPATLDGDGGDGIDRFDPDGSDGGDVFYCLTFLVIRIEV